MASTRSTAASRFEVERALGEGGQADVFVAYDRLFERPVALKRYRAPCDLEALTRDFRSAAEVVHPNVARVYDLWLEGDAGFLALELFEREVRAVDLDGARLAARARDLLAGLGAIHARGLVHGDIKPSNILVRGERVAFTDFGLSSLAGSRRAGHGGTPEYFAPELACGAAPSPASDLFALGLTVVELLSGEVPRLRGVFTEPWLDHPWLTGPRPLPDRLGAAGEAIAGLLELDPASRRSPVAPSPAAGPRWVGRARELRLLDAALRRVREARHPMRVDVRGASGLGKSALVRAWSDAVEAATVVVARCRPNDSLPFALLDGMLERLGASSEVPAELTAAAAKARHDGPRAAVDVLRRFADVRPLVLVVDDAQYGDADSGRALRALMEGEARPLLLVLAHRGTCGLIEALEGVPAQAAVELGPLGPDEVLEIVRARDIDVDRVGQAQILARCRGEPFLAGYLGQADFEAGAARPVEARFADVHPSALELALLLRAAEGPLAREVLLSACSEPDAAAGFLDLLDAGLLQRAGAHGEVELTHERLILDGWAALEPSARRATHARLAGALREWGGSEEALALQLARAGRPADARPYARVAADRAAARGAAVAAARFEAIHLEGVLARPGGPEEVREARRAAARAALASGEGRAAAAQLEALAEAETDPWVRVGFRLEAAEALLAVAELPAARRILEEVSAPLGLALPRSLARRLLASARARRRLGPDYLASLRELEARAGGDARDRLRRRFLEIVAGPMGAFEMHPEAQPRLLLEARAAGDLDGLVTGLSLGLVYAAVLGMDDPPEAEAEALLEGWRPAVGLEQRAFCDFTRAYALVTVGRYVEAATFLERAIEATAGSRSRPWFEPQARLLLMACDWTRGRFDEVVLAVSAARAEWTLQAQPGLIHQLEVYGGAFAELLEDRPRLAVRRLRRAELSKGSPSLEFMRVAYLSGAVRAAGRPRIAQALLLRHGRQLAPKLVEVFSRVFILWYLFCAVADRPRLGWGRRLGLRTILAVMATSRTASARGVRLLCSAALELRGSRPRRGRALARLARRELSAVDMRPFAAAADDLLVAAAGGAGGSPRWAALGAPPARLRRFFRPPWPERGL